MKELFRDEQINTDPDAIFKIRYNMFLQHGKQGFDRCFVPRSKLKVPNIRVKYLEMRDQMRKDFKWVMNVEEELKNGRPPVAEEPFRSLSSLLGIAPPLNAQYSALSNLPATGSMELGSAVAGLKKAVQKRNEEE